MTKGRGGPDRAPRGPAGAGTGGQAREQWGAEAAPWRSPTSGALRVLVEAARGVVLGAHTPAHGGPRRLVRHLRPLVRARRRLSLRRRRRRRAPDKRSALLRSPAAAQPPPPSPLHPPPWLGPFLRAHCYLSPRAARPAGLARAPLSPPARPRQAGAGPCRTGRSDRLAPSQLGTPAYPRGPRPRRPPARPHRPPPRGAALCTRGLGSAGPARNHRGAGPRGAARRLAESGASSGEDGEEEKRREEGRRGPLRTRGKEAKGEDQPRERREEKTQRRKEKEEGRGGRKGGTK